MNPAQPTPFLVVVLTLFPQAFPGPLGCSLLGKALEKGLWKLHVVDIREFSSLKHQKVDAPTFGGGRGLVMRPCVLHEALSFALAYVKKITPAAPRFVFPSPRGTRLSQYQCALVAQEKRPLIILCGRYEGIDERIFHLWPLEEVCIGDFVLMGGEIAAMALVESCARLIEGVVGNNEFSHDESFGPKGLLEYPHYTRPRVWNGELVPAVLVSGNHQKINEWKHHQSMALTKKRRPDLWAAYQKHHGDQNKRLKDC